MGVRVAAVAPPAPVRMKRPPSCFHFFLSLFLSFSFFFCFQIDLFPFVFDLLFIRNSYELHYNNIFFFSSVFVLTDFVVVVVAVGFIDSAADIWFLCLFRAIDYSFRVGGNLVSFSNSVFLSIRPPPPPLPSRVWIHLHICSHFEIVK